jgi:hypothetical protein
LHIAEAVADTHTAAARVCTQDDGRVRLNHPVICHPGPAVGIRSLAALHRRRIKVAAVPHPPKPCPYQPRLGMTCITVLQSPNPFSVDVDCETRTGNERFGASAAIRHGGHARLRACEGGRRSTRLGRGGKSGERLLGRSSDARLDLVHGTLRVIGGFSDHG